MLSEPLILPMFMHLAWVVLLYTLLTIVRAPAVWGVGLLPDGSSPWTSVEARVSANLSNQFEWPLFFHVICLLLILGDTAIDSLQQGLAWAFIAGRIIHSGVQILMNNIRLRGIVFTINFLAVLGMWSRFLLSHT